MTDTSVGRYRFTPSASADVDSIYGESVHLFGETQADRYHDELHRMFTLLADHPRITRSREEIDGVVRAYPFKAHIVVYEIDDAEDILIIRVRHGHEDWHSDPS